MQMIALQSSASQAGELPEIGGDIAAGRGHLEPNDRVGL
jgi:hypothetical protein